MPDIDVDFCFERRQEVIDYVVRKYGKDRVAQIVTFGTLAARGVLRDVGRVMDMPYAFVDSIAKMVPQELNITLDRALKTNPEFKTLYDTNEQVKELVDMSMRLEGLPRHTSMHAAGVVISQKAVDEYVPLSRAQDGSLTTQFTMTTLEELGLLKMDFLGLRTLTVIQNAVRMAEQGHGCKIDVDHIDYNDKAVLDSLGTGKTDGVFQLESTGMKNFMKELKPQSLEDIIAGISLYRPGPMDFIPQYIREKIIRRRLLTTARSWNRSWNRPMAVLSIRSRLCRSCRSWQVIHWVVQTWCAVPCQRRRQLSCSRNARILYMEMKRKAYLGVFPEVSGKCGK